MRFESPKVWQEILQMTRRKKHKPEQIVAKLRDADVIFNSGKDLAVVLQSPGVSEADVPSLEKAVRRSEG